MNEITTDKKNFIRFTLNSFRCEDFEPETFCLSDTAHCLVKFYHQNLGDIVMVLDNLEIDDSQYDIMTGKGRLFMSDETLMRLRMEIDREVVHIHGNEWSFK